MCFALIIALNAFLKLCGNIFDLMRCVGAIIPAAKKRIKSFYLLGIHDGNNGGESNAKKEADYHHSDGT
ncbi:MAG: hypothetical protein DRR19_05940 [Candidatus Parabeggiatoa sp. nov. 1]|nr:MAG: hypothetical protein DRR19_05940 [Gammaproteobacteria bacterium]